MANGLLDFLKTPEGQGLLGAAAGYAANAGRGGPVNAIGRGLLGGIGAYGQATDRASREAEEAQQREVRGMQLAQLKNTAADEQWVRENAPKFYRAGSDASATPSFDMQGFANARMAQNPSAGMQLLQSLQKDTPFNKVDAKDFTPESIARFAQTRNYSDLMPVRKMEVANNGQVYDPYRVQPGTTFIDPNKPFAVGPEGLVPNAAYQQFELNKARAGASKNILSPIFKQEGEEAKTVGKFYGDAYADIQKAGFNAQNSINRMDRLGQLLDGVDTGKFAGVGLEVAKAAQAAGLKVDPSLANKEAAVALSSEIALQLRNPSGGAGMPGAMSDADRNFLAGMVPGIEKTPEGRKTIIETAKKLAERDREVASMARDYRKKHGSLNEGFYDELARHSESKPLFGGQQKKPEAPKATMRYNPITKKLEPV